MNARQRYQSISEGFEIHIEECLSCYAKVWQNTGMFCQFGRQLADELDSATIAALHDNNSTFLGGQQCAQQLC